MSQRRGGLGKGLGAIIPGDRGGVTEVDIDLLSPGPHQPRQSVADARLQELADSISAKGVLQPLLVARADHGYVIIAGERRWRAARLAGLRSVPVLVQDATPQDMLEIALVENLQREDLGPLEQATAYRQLVEEHGLSQEAIARRVGKSRAAVANSLRLLALPQQVQSSLTGGEITEGHARALAGCHEDLRLAAWERVRKLKLNVRQTEELVRRLAAPPRPRQTSASNTASTEWVEEQFRHALGTKVELRRSSKGGRLVIHFYSEEQLQGICDLLLKEQ